MRERERDGRKFDYLKPNNSRDGNERNAIAFAQSVPNKNCQLSNSKSMCHLMDSMPKNASIIHTPQSILEGQYVKWMKRWLHVNDSVRVAPPLWWCFCSYNMCMVYVARAVENGEKKRKNIIWVINHIIENYVPLIKQLTVVYFDLMPIPLYCVVCSLYYLHTMYARCGFSVTCSTRPSRNTLKHRSFTSLYVHRKTHKRLAEHFCEKCSSRRRWRRVRVIRIRFLN